MNPINQSFQKITNENQYSGRTGRTDSGDTICPLFLNYMPPIFKWQGHEYFSLSKQSQTSRSILQDESRCLRLSWRGKSKSLNQTIW